MTYQTSWTAWIDGQLDYRNTLFASDVIARYVADNPATIHRAI